MNLQENIRTLLKEEYGRKYILYRGVGLDEAIKSCETGHLVYYSRDPMSRDWEVIKYGLGSEASEMSEEEVEEYVNNLVSWKRKSKGVNLTSDLDNAKGYSDIVLEINLVGYDYAEFSDVHIFAKNPEDCKIKSVYYNGKEYSKEGFLDITKSLQESIRRILREELNKDILIDGLYDPIYEENGIVLFKEPKNLKVYSKFDIKKSNVKSGKEFNKKYVDFNNKKLHKVLYKNGITLGGNLGEGKYWCSTEYCLSVYLGETQESEEYSRYVKEVVDYKLGDDMKILVKKYISDNLW